MRARLNDERVHVSFVQADPPRSSWLALWTADPAVELDLTDSLTIVRPNDETGNVAARQTAVERVELSEVIEMLASNGSEASDSENSNVWVAAVNAALTIAASGRLKPGLSPAGYDAWQFGQLTADEQAHIAALAAALPPAGHSHVDNDGFSAGPGVDDAAKNDLELATGADGSTITANSITVPTPEATIRAFMQAVIDRFSRPAAASMIAGHEAFAVADPVVIDSGAALRRLSALSGERAPLTTLRIKVPGDDSDHDNIVGTLVFQSRLDPSLTVPAASLWAAPEATRKSFAPLESALLLNLRRAARRWEPITRLLEQPRPTDIELSEGELDELAGPLGSELGAGGLAIIWPTDLITGITLTPVLGPSERSLEDIEPFAGRTTRLDLSSLLELRWQGEIDGEPLTAAELAALADANRAVVRVRGRWIRVESDQLRRLGERRSVGAGAALAAALGGGIDLGGPTEATVEVVGPLATLGDRLRGLDTLRELDPPDGFTAELRPYQRRGLAWLNEMDELGLGGVLADDMGLGKTIQLLALHAHRHATMGPKAGPTLVICPTSVVGNWERETNRFSPATEVLRYHGVSRSVEGLGQDAIVLTSYGVARRDAARLADVEWGLVVADEAQAIKNPRSRTARALRTIQSGTRFALTGTPIQNQLVDLWAILDWSTPGLLGPLERFRRELATPIERDGDAEVTAQLNRLLRPFLLRRRKTDPDIAPDLPPKTETDEIVPLTEEQASLYAAVVSEVMAEIAAATGIERRGLVLRLVTRLKQVCNHPEHLLAEEGELEGRSGKLTATDDLLDVIVEGGEAALVFTQYVAMGHLLQGHFESRGLRTFFLHGGLGPSQREDMVDRFQNGEADVFVVSLRAGGTGLNLTAATHVIHYDRWWNPAVEDQASDRAWRIGQDRPVHVHRLISEGTIEDRIAALLRDKRSVAQAVVGAGEGWISELNDDDLAELVALSGEAGGW